ncbi:tRNA pseudouridine(38-40) synthase TruA [Clostridium sp. MCC353]|uniref:tRNA pseudouridine(38-40) synthase TruA n=1 Tax=Clostridium sp. MCC353 TaxID=2592646 RepID=UPI001C036B95|nr:tRNA pseudouridine(38-40) synthase TruA [Clostridium sp. MCC353]MBT9777160.1 tRNA pseudouridine(38-40) synthase TruA [Clostridium sp. MCC353]
MKRVRLIVSYDGTNYCGWQVQPNGITIEEVLNQHLSALLKEEITVIGASRTDSGVHALGNVAIFDTENRMPADKICFALNQRLPEDIRIQKSEEVPLDWHPRKCNCTKTYEYRILNRKIDMPVSRLYSHFCYFPLDVEKMKAAAGFIVGEHDFKSFCTVRSQAEETVRTIYSLDIDRRDDMITIRISGSGFLYNMVRIIAGTLMKVGMGVYLPEHVEEIIDARDRQKAGPKVPAKGLTLVSLEYETELPKWLEGENKYWSYGALQTHIKEEKTGYLLIKRCADEEWAGVLRRMIHQIVRNGADFVYVADLEKDRLKAGDIYGFYEMEEPEGERIALSLLDEEERERIREMAGAAAGGREVSGKWYLAKNKKVSPICPNT